MATSPVSARLIGMPRSSCSFQAPSHQPMAKMTDTIATTMTTVGNHPLMMEKLMASSIGVPR